MRDTLRHEIVAYLSSHGASTAGDIRIGVRARRADVDQVLAGEPFSVVPSPEGSSPRAVHYGLDAPDVSQLVPVPNKAIGTPPRHELMLKALADGKPHTRHDIFRLTGAFFLTNNAASELRQRGHRIVRSNDGKVVLYQLVGDFEPATEEAA